MNLIFRIDLGDRLELLDHLSPLLIHFITAERRRGIQDRRRGVDFGIDVDFIELSSSADEFLQASVAQSRRICMKIIHRAISAREEETKRSPTRSEYNELGPVRSCRSGGR